MSQLLAFHESLWLSAKSSATQGHYSQALHQLQPLLQYQPGSSTKFTLLAHRLAGRIYFAQEKYRKARQLFRVALRLDPTCGATWYDHGQAFENDPYGCDTRAAKCYARAVKFAPQEAKFQAAYGLALVRLNRLKNGLARLADAAQLAGKDTAILRTVVTGYLDAGEPDRAADLLQAIRFQRPNDRKIEQLWQQVRFAFTAAGQRRQKPKLLNRVIPYLRISRDDVTTTATSGVIRHDFSSKPQPHLRMVMNYRGERG